MILLPAFQGSDLLQKSDRDENLTPKTVHMFLSIWTATESYSERVNFNRIENKGWADAGSVEVGRRKSKRFKGRA
jgi:cyclophilin family peptidyl-prolyl cis-trans isomerase